MSKKRVFDEELGVELVLDEETEDELSNSRRSEEDNEPADGRGRKKPKFESRLTDSNPKYSTSQTQATRNSSAPNQTSSQTEDSLSRPKLEGDDSDSENYEDIDYGDDDDDDDNFHHKEHQSDKSKLGNDILNTLLSNQNEKLSHENGDKDCKGEERDADQSRDAEENADDEQVTGEEDGAGKEPAEKCKYWPSCTAGDECTYYHPSKPCRAFPNCRFGKKCLFIHPPCKFNPNCAKPACPYAHPISTARRAPPNLFRAAQPLAPRCKFGFNCMNLMCKFSHQRPEPCRFGANCLLETCSYTHPSDVARSKPTSAFKWSAQSE